MVRLMLGAVAMIALLSPSFAYGKGLHSWPPRHLSSHRRILLCRHHAGCIYVVIPADGDATGATEHDVPREHDVPTEHGLR